MAPIQRSVTSWNSRQVWPAGWISVPDLASGMLTRPLIAPPPPGPGACSASSILSIDRACGRIDLRRLLRRGRRGQRDHKHQSQRADDDTSVCKQFRHATSSLCILVPR